ncbi:MAG: hypothetical protein OEZ59_07285 [Deltaproteobacteria bacterium]|nr:hypothetical protein [Deltaproteobacteria bacterium]
MVITDLKTTCSRCKGSGYNPGFSVMGVNQINYHGQCPGCSGRGFTLTELGQDVVNLLKPYIRELLEEERKTADARRRITIAAAAREEAGEESQEQDGD